jgi:hypothetical protein
METLGRWVRFVFGLQAFMITLLPASLYVAAQFYFLARNPAPSPHPMPQGVLDALSASVWHCARLGFIGLLSLAAWWALRKGRPSARVWALTASVASIGNGGFGLLVGLAGVIAFWKAGSAASVGGKAAEVAPHKPVDGDGTHKYVEQCMPFVIIAALFGARMWWATWGDEQGLPPAPLPGWLLVALAIHLGVIVHEVGHFLCGLSTDMVLRNFQLGPFQGQINEK